MYYTKLADTILTSTVWMENDQTRILWLTLLAMVDKNGEVHASVPGLANVARLPIDAVESALTVFLSPDPYSRTKTDEGRRIEIIDGGWFLINHAKYRALSSDNDRKTKAAERQQRQRDRKKSIERDAVKSGVTACDKSRQTPHTDTDTDTDTDTKAIETKQKKETTGGVGGEPKRKKENGSFSTEFLTFWESYPVRRRTAKARAWKAWLVAIKKETSEKIITSAVEYAKSPEGSGEFCKGPEPWLNGGCWDDSRESWGIVAATPPRSRVFRYEEDWNGTDDPVTYSKKKGWM